MTFDTEHLGANIIVRTEERHVGHVHTRRYTTIGRTPYWACSENGGRACLGHGTVAVAPSVRSLPCKKAGHPPEMRRYTPSGWSYCGGCQEDSRQRYRERKAA